MALCFLGRDTRAHGGKGGRGDGGLKFRTKGRPPERRRVGRGSLTVVVPAQAIHPGCVVRREVLVRLCHHRPTSCIIIQGPDSDVIRAGGDHRSRHPCARAPSALRFADDGPQPTCIGASFANQQQRVEVRT